MIYKVHCHRSWYNPLGLMNPKGNTHPKTVLKYCFIIVSTHWISIYCAYKIINVSHSDSLLIRSLRGKDWRHKPSSESGHSILSGSYVSRAVVILLPVYWWRHLSAFRWLSSQLGCIKATKKLINTKYFLKHFYSGTGSLWV